MSICWFAHTPMAMQRHTGSVFDAASRPSKSQASERETNVVLPEYGDPVWLHTEAATPQPKRRAVPQQERIETDAA